MTGWFYTEKEIRKKKNALTWCHSDNISAVLLLQWRFWGGLSFPSVALSDRQLCPEIVEFLRPFRPALWDSKSTCIPISLFILS